MRTGHTERERQFHDHRFDGRGQRGRVGKYYAIDAGKARYRELLFGMAAAGVRMLDCGCGPGGLSVRLARAGATVTGVDISPVAIRRARRRALRLRRAVEYRVMDVESLEFADGSFDVVYGSGILHHLDTDRAYAEVARVLRPEGTAIFVEPLGHNPLLKLYRSLTPSIRSPDEHPLLIGDIERAREHFRSARWEPFDLLALAAVPVHRFEWAKGAAAALHAVDRQLFEHSALARRWAWVTVLTFTK